MQKSNSGHIFTICSTASITAYTAGDPIASVNLPY